MTTVTYKYIVFCVLLFSSIVINAQNINEVSKDSVSSANNDKLLNTSTSDVKVNYSDEYEKALKREVELKNRKEALDDSVKLWTKEYNKLQDNYASIVGSTEKTIKKIKQAELKMDDFGVLDLLKNRDSLLLEIQMDKKEIALLKSQLQDVNNKLNDKKSQKENLGKIKENVVNQIINENRDYLCKLFQEMDLATLNSMKSKCQKYSTDAKVNAFVAKIDNTINNKQLYDNIIRVVNSPYKKFDVDRALKTISQFKNICSLQQDEVYELKKQLTIFPEGLKTFKEFINNLNECREGVNYSLRYFEEDNKRIYQNNLQQRISTEILVVPYLKLKYESFMKIFKKDPNRHSDIEKEILNQ
ncbi:MAG TPA: hypothetical protein OIM43_00375 [Prevotellaceae bacterium]|nr:hypothetical protein [Prevotellaceae bacterium]